MEVRINKEVRDYQEAVFFGLSLRQFVFSVLAIGISVALHFPLSRIVGDVEIGWICILGGAALCSMRFCSLQRHDLREAGVGHSSLGVLYAQAVGVQGREPICKGSGTRVYPGGTTS